MTLEAAVVELGTGPLRLEPSRPEPSRPEPSRPEPSRPIAPRLFGRGGGFPYARALRRGRGTLDVVAVGPLPGSLPDGANAPALGEIQTRHDVSAWFRATAAERELLRGLGGPVLDVGCGPGRLLAAARSLGLDAVGIDVDPDAVLLARRAGGDIIHGSVFDSDAELGAARRSGAGWGSVLLVDGNIGIGGDPAALLARVGELAAAGALAWVEASPHAWANHRFLASVRDARGRESAAFPWATVGWKALPALAASRGWDAMGTRHAEGRVFCLLRRR